MSKVKADLVVAEKSPDLEIQIRDTINWLKQQEKTVKKLVQDNPKAAVKLMIEASTLQLKAQRVKMYEVQREGAILELSLKREIGILLFKHGVIQGAHADESSISIDSLGIDRPSASRFKKLAEIPSFAFKHALSANMPSMNQVLKECLRYSELKVVSDHAEADTKDLKRFVLEGYTVSQAKEELFSDESDDSSVDNYIDDDDDDLIMETNFKESMDTFMANAEAMPEIVSEIAEAFEDEESIDREDYMVGLTAVKLMATSVTQLKAVFKEGKEKISD